MQNIEHVLLWMNEVITGWDQRLHNGKCRKGGQSSRCFNPGSCVTQCIMVWVLGELAMWYCMQLRESMGKLALPHWKPKMHLNYEQSFNVFTWCSCIYSPHWRIIIWHLPARKCTSRWDQYLREWYMTRGVSRSVICGNLFKQSLQRCTWTVAMWHVFEFMIEQIHLCNPVMLISRYQKITSWRLVALKLAWSFVASAGWRRFCSQLYKWDTMCNWV